MTKKILSTALVIGTMFMFIGCGGGSTDSDTDTTHPVIMVTGGTMTLSVGGIYTPPTVTASDDVDGDITSDIVVGGDVVDDSVAGTYVVTYNVTDSSGNVAQEQTFTVVITEEVVVDTVKPVITVTGGTTSMEVGDVYTEPTVTASDDVDGDITSSIVEAGDVVDPDTIGTYVVTYDVSDSSGNAAATVNHTVVVKEKVIPDTTPPVITVTGGTTTLYVGGEYIAPTVTAIDNVDGDITSDIVFGGYIDNDVAGTYVFTYNVTDSSGNDAQEQTFTVVISEVVIVDTVKPVITVTGGTTSITVGDTYTAPTVTAFDNLDGDITSEIAVAGDVVDNSFAGTYVVTYNVMDSSGNEAIEKTFTVVVNPVIIVDTTPPVITVTGGTTSMTVGDVYTAPTVTANDNIDGDITSSIVEAGDTVNPNVAGTYTVTYNVSDESGNAATQKTHTVVVNAVVVVNTAPIWTASSYDTGLTIEDSTDDPQTIMDLTSVCSDPDGDAITYSIVSIATPHDAADGTAWSDSIYIENGVLKVHNLFTNDPNYGNTAGYDPTVSVIVRASATGGSSDTEISFEFKNTQ